MGIIQKVLMVLLIVFIVFGAFVVKSKDLDMDNPSDLKVLLGEEVKLMGNLVKNTISLTANAVRMDWLPKS